MCNLTGTGLLLNIIFIYVTFAPMWDGRYYVIAIDYDRNFIIDFSSLQLNKR